jgi:spermidine synthase
VSPGRAVAALAAACVLGAAVLLGGGAVGRAETVVARIPTGAGEPPVVVVDEGEHRCFYFEGGEELRQSCVHRADPLRIRFEYVRLMFAATLLVERPRRVLVLGMGGATLAGLVQTYYPDAALDVVEIEPAVVLMAGRFFGFAPGPRTRVHVADARAFVEERAGGEPYDLVLVDCFDETYIPSRLRTLEFARAVERVLAPDGVVVANVFSRHPLYERVAATWAAVLPHVRRLPARSTANHILVAAARPLGTAPEPLEARAGRVERAIGKAWPYPVGPLLRRLEPVPAKALRATVLRDPPAAPADAPAPDAR